MVQVADLSKYVGDIDYALWEDYKVTVDAGKPDENRLKIWAETVEGALTKTGAATIKNAPILECKDRIMKANKNFFAQAPEIKDQSIYFKSPEFTQRFKGGEDIEVIKNEGGIYDNRGFVRYGLKKPDDYKEFYHVDSGVYRAFKGQKIETIPDLFNAKAMRAQLDIQESVHDFVEASVEMTEKGREMGEAMLTAFAYTFNLPNEFVRRSKDADSVLRMLHYMKFNRELLAQYPMMTRARAHKDVALQTFLMTSDEPGLQIVSSQTLIKHFDTTYVTNKQLETISDEDWIDIPPMADRCVYNCGAQLEIKSNGMYPATGHRVVVVPGREDEERWSTPFFSHAEWDDTMTVWDEAVRRRGGENHFAQHDGDHDLTVREFVLEDAKRKWIAPQKSVGAYTLR